MEYNTTRNQLIMREYGRHIQKMVDKLMMISDREVRQKGANAIVELMSFFNPQLKNVEDFRHKLWDQLFLISDFFSTPLANQKKARYNMTKRTEMVIFQGGCDLGFYRLRD